MHDIEARANQDSIEEARHLLRTLTTHVGHQDPNSGKLVSSSSDPFIFARYFPFSYWVALGLSRQACKPVRRRQQLLGPR